MAAWWWCCVAPAVTAVTAASAASRRRRLRRWGGGGNKAASKAASVAVGDGGRRRSHLADTLGELASGRGEGDNGQRRRLAVPGAAIIVAGKSATRAGEQPTKMAVAMRLQA